MRISSSDCLAPGTLVRVGNKRGTVTKSEMVNACNGGKVALNTISFNAVFRRSFGAQGSWKDLPASKPVAVNYASIIVIG